MPKFPKTMWNVRLTHPSDPDRVLLDNNFRSRLGSNARRQAVREAVKLYPGQSWRGYRWEVNRVQGPDIPLDIQRRRSRELARQRRDNQMYAYYGQSDWDGGDFVSPIEGDNYYDMAKDFLWNGDLSDLDPEDVAIATEQLEPFRGVTDDVAFGRMLDDRLSDREAYLFALRRGGRRKPPVWVNPENFDELDRRGWAGDDERDEDYLWKYINWSR